MNWIKTAIGVISKGINTIGGLSSLWSIVVTIAVIGGIGLYLVDDIHYKPIRVAKEATRLCYLEYNKTEYIKDSLLGKAGIVISDLGQQIYDLNQSVKQQLSEGEIKLIECNSELEKANWRLKHEKINTSDEFFYTKLPF